MHTMKKALVKEMHKVRKAHDEESEDITPQILRYKIIS
jgi:hypothetical protein